MVHNVEYFLKYMPVDQIVSMLSRGAGIICFFFFLPNNKLKARKEAFLQMGYFRLSQQGYLGIQASLVRFFISSRKELKNGHK